MDKQLDAVFFAEYRFRGEKGEIGIRRADRRSHMYIIGKTGTGKTTLLEQMISEDMRNGEGLAVLDPHGDFVERLVKKVPEHRKDDFIYFNVLDPHSPYAFNPLAFVPPERRPLAASEMVESFKKLFSDSWGSRLEHILRNVFLTLLDQPQATLADIKKLFFEDRFRLEAIGNVSNVEVRDFWLGEFASYSPSQLIQAISPIHHKVSAFLTDPNLQRVMTQHTNNLDVRRIIDEGKILLVNLSKGMLGGDNASVLGSLLVSRIGLAALSRADQPEQERKDFYLYLDEFQNFTTLSMADMLSELRKYRLNIILAHQYLKQVEPDIQDAILGNVGTMITFRVGLKDAAMLEKEFGPKFTAQDLSNLPNYEMYIRLMINGQVSKPFSARTISPYPEPPKPSSGYYLDIVVIPRWFRNLWKKRPPFRIVRRRKPNKRYTSKRS